MATLEQASLSPAERRALERAVAVLEAELGEELLAVWLLGPQGADPWALSLQIHARDWVADARREETAFRRAGCSASSRSSRG